MPKQTKYEVGMEFTLKRCHTCSGRHYLTINHIERNNAANCFQISYSVLSSNQCVVYYFSPFSTLYRHFDNMLKENDFKFDLVKTLDNLKG